MSQTILSGQSTTPTKMSLEGYLFVNAAQIHNVGQYSSLGNSSGNYAQVNDCLPSPNNAPYSFSASGENLMLRVNTYNGLQSSQPMVVSVVGTAVGGGAQTGTATFPANAPEDMAMQVLVGGVVTAFASVTSVTATNGTFGDGFDLCTFPDYTKNSEIGYVRGINIDLGTEVLEVYKHYLIDHVKRKRRAGKLTIDNLYQNNLAGLSAYNNRMIHMVVEIRDNGQNSPTEVHIIDQVAGTAKGKFGKDDSEVTETYDGFFGRRFIFS